MSLATVPQGRIDWQEARARVLASERSIAAAFGESPERAAALYRRRAERLAKAQDALAQINNTGGVATMVFSLQQERFAVAMEHLVEVLPFTDCTTVPGARSEFLGVINVRGELRPVVDLSRMVFGSPSKSSACAFVLLMRYASHDFGLKVDRVEGLHTIRGANLGSLPDGKYLTRTAGETLMLLDVEKLTADISLQEG